MFMSIRKGWRTISWAAWKLQKEYNQKNQSVIDTQPRVVIHKKIKPIAEPVKEVIEIEENTKLFMNGVITLEEYMRLSA